VSRFDPGPAPSHGVPDVPHGQVITRAHPAWHRRTDDEVWGTLAETRHNPFHDALKPPVGDWGDSTNAYFWDGIRERHPEKYQAAQHALHRAVSGMHIAVAVPSLALHDIADEGRLRSAFHIGDDEHWSDNPDYKDIRRRGEFAHFRYPMKGHPDHARPIYGHLTSDPFTDASTEPYGHHTLVLSRAAVGHRTTFTGADSLDQEHKVRASPLTEPGLHSLNPATLDPRKPDLGVYKAVTDRSKYSPYIEAQIHGGVEIGRDVHHVILRTPEHESEHGWAHSTGERLGVPWIHTRGFSRPDRATAFSGVPAHRLGAILAAHAAVATGAFVSDYRPEIIWHQGHERFIVELAAHGMGQIADLEWGALYPPMPIASILARGYWQRLPHPVDAEDVLAKVRPVT